MKFYIYKLFFYFFKYTKIYNIMKNYIMFLKIFMKNMFFGMSKSKFFIYKSNLMLLFLYKWMMMYMLFLMMFFILLFNKNYFMRYVFLLKQPEYWGYRKPQISSYFKWLLEDTDFFKKYILIRKRKMTKDSNDRGVEDNTK